ncbi:class I SAM-dependent methyltransferase [Asticcacaulis machinosus]|uniref:Class I SAM-dependent methyltransferase n=1 Tax=Asticcacaulis machinosus TaxID=2984211 RepID=A0ABT5HIP4_9CAUL|nr:class I SAM-dependent methyltransferase [Asticcacaulis machinosus]MDC7675863.1 class I SAM-dependent methyltransferase [Asticcacaulis machinosus]
MNVQPSYAALTRHDPNPFKRWLQNRRFRDAIRLLGPRHQARIVDYGAGDGELVVRLKVHVPDAEFICFEPTHNLLTQAQAHLMGYDGVRLTAASADIQDSWADAVFCLEVFEHLPPEETKAALKEMYRILKPGGELIIGVPVETGPIAVVKGLFRSQRRQDFDTDWRRIWRAAQGDAGFERHKVWMTPDMAYYPHHLGFDHKALIKAVAPWFQVVATRSSPASILPAGLNTELNIRLVRKSAKTSDDLSS